MIVSKKFIPSLFTILNAFCGFASVINASNNEFETAVLFIVYAAVFDVFDGLVARILDSASDFGVELDSLSDIVSFGFAPAFLLYQFFFIEYEAMGILVASSVLAFSAIRLARFNISLTGFNKDVFYGVPTPMSALILCSYVIYFHDKIFTKEFSEIFIFVLTISVSLLMVSNLRFPAMPSSFSWRAVKSNPMQFIFLAAGVLIIIFTKGVAIFPLGLLYLLIGIIITIFPAKKKRNVAQKT
ncbi:MAG: CDP-diacylglycerol--serine O-phosphatidyltransferase [Candidatus Kapaibacterium sp.]